MRILTNGISPEVLQALGWTLLHFVWQGAGLAAVLAVANTVCRRPTTRYALAVTTLILMMAAPLITFRALDRQKDPAVRRGERGASASAVRPVQAVSVTARPSAPAPESPAIQQAEMLVFVEAWFLGVVLMSLRTVGGLFLIEKIRRKEIKPVAREVYEKCLALQRKMHLEGAIRYCECLRLHAPAVLGWFRPVVLLPARALTGLAEDQIEMIIAHELAHIRRLDCFVNLFQIGVDTLLFYHPAVWWVSQRIRTEREHCCDDEAVTICGDAVSYARALTVMEEWRTVPSLLMAANRSPLSQRVVRLLGLDGPASRVRVAGLAVGVVCLAGAMLAGNAFLGVARAAVGGRAIASHERENNMRVVQEPRRGSASVVRLANASASAKHFASEGQAGKDKDKEEAQKASEEANKKESYLDAMEAAGLKNLSADELIAMKTQGVTPDYVREIHDLGLKPSADEFVGMRVQGITPEYVREMHTIASSLNVDELIGMKVQGITPQYANDLHALGLQPAPDSLIGMKVQGITPEYVRAMQAVGLKPGVDGLIGMKVQGITPEYVKSIQAAGFKDLDVDELIGAKAQGITPEFIEKVRKHGFQNLTLDKLIALKHADVF